MDQDYISKGSKKASANLFGVELRVRDEGRLHFRMKLDEDTSVDNLGDGGRINGAKFEFRNPFLRQNLVDLLFGLRQRISGEKGESFIL